MGRIGMGALAALAVALAGCVRTVVPEQVLPAPAVLPSSFSLQVMPWLNSGESAQATFIPLTTGQTQIQVQFNGTPGPHMAFLQLGSCEAMGAVVAKMGKVDVGSNGVGTKVVNVDLPISVLRDGNHFIVFHQAHGTPGNPVACTNIPRY